MTRQKLPLLSSVDADSLADLADDPDAVAVRADSVDGWAVLIEQFSNRGLNEATLPELSRGTEAVSVFSSGQGTELLYYAVDGLLTTVVQTTVPEHRYGSDPDRFLGTMRAVGLAPGERDGEGHVRAATMSLVALEFGVSIEEYTMFDKKLPTALISR